MYRLCEHICIYMRQVLATKNKHALLVYTIYVIYVYTLVVHTYIHYIHMYACISICISCYITHVSHTRKLYKSLCMWSRCSRRPLTTNMYYCCIHVCTPTNMNTCMTYNLHVYGH